MWPRPHISVRARCVMFDFLSWSNFNATKHLSPPPNMNYANYLPDELLLEILSYFPKGPESQQTLARFCRVSRQWYDLGVIRLYESPYITGPGFERFHDTICPSKSPFGRKSDLAILGK